MVDKTDKEVRIVIKDFDIVVENIEAIAIQLNGTNSILKRSLQNIGDELTNLRAALDTVSEMIIRK